MFYLELYAAVTTAAAVVAWYYAIQLMRHLRAANRRYDETVHIYKRIVSTYESMDCIKALRAARNLKG